MMHLFGRTEIDPLCRLMLCIGSLFAVFSVCNKQLRILMAERSIEKRGARFHAYGGRRYDYRVIKTALPPVAIATAAAMLLCFPVSLPFLTFSFFIGGVILFIIGNMRQGNKDSRRMTKLDSMLIGGLGCLSAIPGISFVGTVASAGIARGAQRQVALNWALLMCIPILLLRIGVDFLLIIVGGTAIGFWEFLFCIGGALSAYLGGRISIRLVKFAMNQAGIAGFSYYLWGAALLTFTLYLIT
jgi:undecaprenyl pyrophosphate phosphatase UppP